MYAIFGAYIMLLISSFLGWFQLHKGYFHSCFLIFHWVCAEMGRPVQLAFSVAKDYGSDRNQLKLWNMQLICSYISSRITTSNDHSLPGFQDYDIFQII